MYILRVASLELLSYQVAINRMHCCFSRSEATEVKGEYIRAIGIAPLARRRSNFAFVRLQYGISNYMTVISIQY